MNPHFTLVPPMNPENAATLLKQRIAALEAASHLFLERLRRCDDFFKKDSRAEALEALQVGVSARIVSATENLAGSQGKPVEVIEDVSNKAKNALSASRSLLVLMVERILEFDEDFGRDEEAGGMVRLMGDVCGAADEALESFTECITARPNSKRTARPRAMADNSAA